MQCRHTLFVSLIIIAMLACLATAQQRGRTPPPHGEGSAESAPPASQAKLVTRVYDVKDLIRPKRDYPFQSIVVPPMHIGSRQEGDGQSLLGGGGGMPPASGIDAAAAVSSEGLINIVTTTIAPGSWRSAGGFEGSLAFQDGLLIISQTEERQQQIGDLLNQLRKDLGPARTVTIKADWVLLPPGQLATFLKENKGGPQEVDIDSIN